MQINDVKLKTPRKKRKIVGRGGKKGTYSGKGNKGQKARSGAHVNPLFEGGRSTLIDHMKKKRGFKSRNAKKIVIKLSELEKKFKDGNIINNEAILKTGLISKKEAKGELKIIGKGELKSKFTVEKEIFLSASSREAIEKAGGKIAA